jgi:hypothetical protein
MKRLFTISAVVLLGHIAGGSHVSAQENSALPTEAPKGRKVAEFLTPDGRFDLEAARLSGFEGSLDLDDVNLQFDPRTGEPRVRPSASVSTTSHSDDIYWDNSISPSVAGLDGNVYAATVYDGRLVVGGRMRAAGDVVANCIAAWDGTSWSALGSGMNYDVLALTVYDGKLIAGGSFETAGGVGAQCMASWDGSGWSPLGSGMDRTPLALTTYDGKLIAGGSFTIAGGKPDMKVSWQLTGVRKDRFAEVNRIQVEVDKKPEERGKYLHPQAFGQSAEAGIDYQHEKQAAEAVSNNQLNEQ